MTIPEPPNGNGSPASTGPRCDRRQVAALLRVLADANPQTLELGVSLRDLTTLRIGGPAAGLCRIVNSEQASRFQAFARSNGVPIYYLGGGSNVLADDAGFSGLILKVEIATYEPRENRLRVGAGLDFDTVIARTLADGLVGLEFASGIPGSLGGAIVGNAGCFGHEIGEFLTEATVLRPDGSLEIVGPEAFAFGYRHSAMKDSGSLLLEAVLDLRDGDTVAALADREAKLALRREKHPPAEGCAGSYFQNLPPDRPGGRRRAAGELLDAAGARSMRVGDAAVFAHHANIIINAGAARSRDVLQLAEQMKAAVRERFGVELVEEVRYLSAGLLL